MVTGLRAYPERVDNFIQGEPLVALDILSLGVDKSWNIRILGLAPVFLDLYCGYTRAKKKTSTFLLDLAAFYDQVW